MDTATKEAYNFPLEMLTMRSVPVLPAEGCAVYFQNQKITSALYPTLLKKWHEETARNYMLQRHGITANLFDNIQWRSMKFALSKLSYHWRATAVKVIHRHLPTQDKLFQQGRVTMSALCPRCMKHNETNSHIFSCPAQAATKQRCQDWSELQKQLVKLRTAVIIQQVWSLHLRPLVALPRTADLLETIIVNTHGDVTFFLRAAIEEQAIIGWEKLLLGMGSSLWQSQQHHIDANHPKPPDRSACDWMNGAMHQMLKFSPTPTIVPRRS